MANSVYEEQLYKEGYSIIAGTDEAGRGPLAGPLVVAAVILPKGYVNPLIDDSKKLSSKKRELLYDVIIKDALAFSIVEISVEDIDKYNIYKCSQNGMQECINKLKIKPDAVISDAMSLPDIKQKVLSLVHGDALSISVAAASILAKVTRDIIMDNLDEKYPGYGFKKHKGYGTKEHIHAIETLGVLDIHRKTYKPVKNMIKN